MALFSHLSKTRYSSLIVREWHGRAQEIDFERTRLMNTRFPPSPKSTTFSSPPVLYNHKQLTKPFYCQRTDMALCRKYSEGAISSPPQLWVSSELTNSFNSPPQKGLPTTARVCFSSQLVWKFNRIALIPFHFRAIRYSLGEPRDGELRAAGSGDSGECCGRKSSGGAKIKM